MLFKVRSRLRHSLKNVTSIFKWSRLAVSLACLLWAFGAPQTPAQNPADIQAQAPLVTAACSTEFVRFTAPAKVYEMRLEVFATDGQTLYDSDFKLGNLLDWGLHDQQGQRLADGAYRCVITTRALYGRLSRRQGLVLLQDGQPALQATQAAQGIRPANPLAAGNVADFLALPGKGAALSLTTLAHDGQQGRLVSGSGGLSFRLGDFFAGKDVEHMRLTAQGNLGIGVENPQAKLDVAGLIRTGEGIVFPDGSVQTTAYVASGRSLSERTRIQRDAQGRSIVEQDSKLESGRRLSPNVSGSGTQGRLAKWTDNAGTLGDSVISELSGNIGIGTTAPTAAIHASRSDGSYQYKMERTGANARVWGFGADTSGDFFIDDVAAMPAVRRFSINTAGFVGIGTSSPAQKLSVISADNTAATNISAVYANNLSQAVGIGYQDIRQLAATIPININAGSTGAVNIGNLSSGGVMLAVGGGNVGIGDSNPASKLTVAGLIHSTSGGIKFPDSTTQMTAGVTNVTVSAPLASSGGATPNLSLTGVVGMANGGTGLSAAGAAGNVLRSNGTTWSNSALQASDLPSLPYVAKAGDTMTGTLTLPVNGLVAGANQLVLSGGKVGIGISNPVNQLDVSNSGANFTAAAKGTTASAGSYGVWGEYTGSGSGIGVYGYASGATGYGVQGQASGTGYGVVGTNTDLVNGVAGQFNGRVNISGNLSKGAGSFKIDHPLDPGNKYLYHSFVESPDMMNIYNGNVATDSSGEAEVVLPDYFEALNRDFRYQLTVIGQFAQAIIGSKIKDSRFTIKTDKPNVEVSWQVTGIRRDAYAEAHRIQVEEEKPEKERGSYLHPEVHGQPEEKGVEWARNPEMMRQLKQQREKAQAEKEKKPN